MTRSDWNQYGAADSNHRLSTKEMYDGVSSLRTDNSNVDSFEILGISESDAPSEARIELQARAGNTSCLYGFYRFQDTSNFYMAGFYYDGSYADAVFGVRKVVGGTKLIVEEDRFSDGDLSSVTLSDGSDPIDRFVPYRIDSWIDSSGDLRFRLSEEADGDGNWSQLGNDVVDTKPDLGSGGGVGIGSYNTDASGEVLYWDNTEVYY